jgi:hypothetical protein
MLPGSITQEGITATTRSNGFDDPAWNEDPAESRVFLRVRSHGGKVGGIRLGRGGRMLIESIESTPFRIPQE